MTEIKDVVRIGPIFMYWSEVPGRGQIQGWGGDDVWHCEEHPDWQGDDFDLKDVEEFKRRGWFADEVDGPDGYWLRESVEAHAVQHDLFAEWLVMRRNDRG